jgi:hypothetical protein
MHIYENRKLSDLILTLSKTTIDERYHKDPAMK